MLFSEGLTAYRDLLEPGRSVVVLVSAEERPEGISVRIQSVESLDSVMAGLKQIRVFVRDAAPLASVAAALGGRRARARRAWSCCWKRGAARWRCGCPAAMPVTPQVASALRAVRGVVQVDLV